MVDGCAHILIYYMPSTGEEALNQRKTNRKGKHKPGKVRIGVYVEPRKKAIAVYIAERKNMSLTDVIWRGIESLALGMGVIDEHGKVTPEHKEALEVVEEIVKKSEVNG